MPLGRCGRKLACEIIHDQFGELVEKACRSLIFQGQQTLPEIGRDTKLDPPTLRTCLLVLCQHNCVQAYKVEADPDIPNSRAQTMYTALTRRILQRMRFPAFLMTVRENMGEEAEAVVEGLLEHGRLSLEQVLQRAVARSGKAEDEMGKELRPVFASLIQASLVERSPAAEPVLPPRPGADLARRGLRGSQRSKGTGAAAGGAEPEEERVMRVAEMGPGERFRLPSSLIGIGGGEETADRKPGVDLRKRKRDVLEGDLSTIERAEERQILWRVNYDEFIRRFRHKRCADHIAAQFDPAAGVVVAAMLEATRSQEETLREKVSAPLVGEAIVNAVRSSPSNQHLSPDRIKSLLQEMSGDPSQPITKRHDGGMGGSYVVNLHDIVATLQAREVEAIVKNRFGMNACRVFRVLYLKRQLEQKQIGEMAMVPIKDTRELLYTLLKAEYVQLQEVAKTADHNPSRTFFLWRVHLPRVLERAVEDVYKAASNVRQRLGFELEREKEVLGVLEGIHLAASQGGHPAAAHPSLTAGQRQQLERVKHMASVLETSLLELDDLVMLLTDF